MGRLAHIVHLLCFDFCVNHELTIKRQDMVFFLISSKSVSLRFIQIFVALLTTLQCLPEWIKISTFILSDNKQIAAEQFNAF